MMSQENPCLQQANVFMSRCVDLGPIPVLVHIVRALMKADEHFDLRPLITAINREPTVTARIIGHANSAIYHDKPEVKSVGDAINLIGLIHSKRIILSAAMAKAFDCSACEIFSLKRYMTDAIYVGYNAASMGGSLSDNDNSFVMMKDTDWYSIGLLHSIGLLFMVQNEPQNMNEVLSSSQPQATSHSLFGFDHFDMSSALLSNWGLPDIFHVPLPHITDSAYRGEYWQVAATLDFARWMTPSSARVASSRVSPDDDNIADLAEKWGVTLPPAAAENIQEALDLVNTVL